MIKVSINSSDTRYIEAAADERQALAPYFTLKELANMNGDKNEPMYVFNDKSAAHVKALNFFREIVGKPVVVNSGYRQTAYNKKVGGDEKSGHLIGAATDIQPPEGVKDYEIIDAWRGALTKAGIIYGAINIYPTYYHLESFTDFLYGAVSPYTIRVHSWQADYEYYKDIYKYSGYKVELKGRK